MRLILVDPKMLELSVYEGIPHLLAPVVTDMKQAAHALNWCVGEMDRRYKLMSTLGVRNLSGFNQKIKEAEKAGKPLTNPFTITPENPEPLQELPLIVVVIDELADLMMVVGKKVEELIARLAQKARAAGVHLILATQRPSVDVITGLIKANIPTRVAFQVSSKVDSRTILDQMGAEQLLGQGDMLYLPPGTGYPQRVHGAFVADQEVHKVVEYLKSRGQPQYIDDVLEGEEADAEDGVHDGRGGWRSRSALRPGRGDRAQVAAGVDFTGAAASAHRLQPGRAPDRADGACRAGFDACSPTATGKCLCRRERKREAETDGEERPCKTFPDTCTDGACSPRACGRVQMGGSKWHRALWRYAARKCKVAAGGLAFFQRHDQRREFLLCAKGRSAEAGGTAGLHCCRRRIRGARPGATRIGLRYIYHAAPWHERRRTVAACGPARFRDH